MLFLSVTWGLKKKSARSTTHKDQMWMYWSPIASVFICCFLSSVAKHFLRDCSVCPLGVSQEEAAHSDLVYSGTGKLLTWEPAEPPRWNTPAVCLLKARCSSLVVCFDFVVFSLSLEKALLYGSMFFLHLKLHLLAKALLLNMYSQLPFMSHLSC